MDVIAANWLLFLIVLVVGIVLGWLFFGLPAGRRRSAAEAKNTDLQSALSRKEQELQQANGELETLRRRLTQEQEASSQGGKQAESLRDEVAQRDEQIAALEAKAAELQVDKEQLRAVLSERELELDKANGRLAGPMRLFREVSGVEANAVSIDLLTPAKAAAIINGILGGLRPRTVTEVQDLVAVRGLGKASEQRLYEAGIGTYWEIANLSDEQMEEILQPTPGQRAQLKFDEVRASALGLAQSTDTVAAIWVARAIDDLEAIPGISSTFEQRLYDAGINTYEDLAATTPERLAEICQAPSTMLPNYPSWIAKAQEIVASRRAAADGKPAAATPA